MQHKPSTTAHLRVYSQNFSTKSIQGEISAGEFNWKFNWKFNDGVNLPGDGYHQFTHLFYAQFEPRSPHFSDIFPIINEIEPIALVRIKANLNMKTPEIVQHEFHTDVDDCITAIYYVNTNNGKTIFESGVEVDSVANRMLIFNSNERHAGTTCTDTLRRCVINFNYFI